MPSMTHPTDAEITALLRIRSVELGWLPRFPRAEPDLVLSARRDPAFAGAPPCVSVYGDSFAYGTPLRDDETFPHHLAVLRGCRVANYGVPGYGSDQAFLLYRAQRTGDRAPIVVLVHLTENVLRNVNQFRDLLYPGGGFGFKPRFRIDARGKLRRVPVPVRAVGEYRVMERSPETALRWEAFLSRPRRDFPHAPRLVRWLATDFLVREKLLDEPWHLRFYAPGHEAGGLAVTARILETFARDAQRRGRIPLVVVLPTALDLIYARRTGRWAAAPLLDVLRQAGVPVLDVGPVFDARLGAREPTTLYDGGRYGHLTAEGYRWLAESLHDALGGGPAQGTLLDGLTPTAGPACASRRR
jgi:hypothetical protein